MSSSKRTRPSKDVFEAAIKEVIEKKQSIRSVTKSFDISKSYLCSLVQKAKNTDGNKHKHLPNIGNRRIFSLEQEKQLAEYLKTSSKMYHGLSTIQAKELAYQYANANKIAPELWTLHKKATKDWFQGFMTRNPSLSIRKPEKTSLARATSFNKENVNIFYDNLEKILKDKNFQPHDMESR